MPTCLIIGASRGIGREFVNQYLSEGWEVHATARKAEDLKSLTDAGATAYEADAADENSLIALAEAVPGQLDVIVHNAGVTAREGPIGDIEPDEWEHVMRVNALGPILSARRLVPKLKQPGGTFAMLTSKMGSIADNGMGGFWSYRMSKAALNMAARNMAHQFEGDGVGIVALHPGHVQTEMGGGSAPTTPKESVEGLRRVISETRPGNDRYFVDFRGQTIPW